MFSNQLNELARARLADLRFDSTALTSYDHIYTTLDSLNFIHPAENHESLVSLHTGKILECREA